MTTREITEDSWRDLEDSLPAYGLYNAKKLEGNEKIFLAVNHNGFRNVLLKINCIDSAINDNHSRGLKVEGKNLVVNEIENAFIVISCSDKEGNKTFNLVASDILHKVVSGLKPADAVIQTLEKWRKFWGSSFRKILTEEQIKGLFGELWFLLVWLLPQNYKFVENWVGPSGSRNDFEWKNLAIEVKTTSSIRGHIHRINGIEQLDSPQDGELYCFSLRIRKEKTAQNTLPVLIKRIQNLLASNQQLLDLFDEKIAILGYSPAHEVEYSEYQYRVIDERLYVVNGEFPRLSVSSFQDGVPYGVERIDYDVNLEVCQECLIANNPYEFNSVLKNN
ncbi:PD-(D/E)XK motif protein [Bacillus salipaludis]|uniref:PD-(D/E)XK motif protein n=1 Tax=Bacillus salipaludis TaxID=2547811 RepID=A0AA90R2M3_9BACI|nr:PD-(D/E)XK motif protein [Bacillus salipaludis]MDQ6598085.1 PD-(D/E)XK motif protein [Bacillus salipaludis]